MARDLRLDAELAGDKAVTAGLHRMAGAVDEVGDEAAQTERQLSRLSREITESELKMKGLIRQFNATGDTAFVKEFGKERRSIAGLRSMQKELDGIEKKGRLASKALQALTPAGGGAAGGGIGSLFGGGFSASRLLMSPAGVGAAGLLTATALPFAGGLAAAGLLGGGAVAATAGVTAVAAQQKTVKHAFAQTFAEIKTQFQGAASAFEKPLIRSAEMFGEAWRRQMPGISKTAATLATFVEPLSKGLSGFVENFLPGFQKGLAKSEPIVKALAKELPELGDALGDMFDVIGEGADGAAAALEKLFDIAEVGVRILGPTLRELSNIFERQMAIDRTIHNFANVGRGASGASVGILKGRDAAKDAAFAFREMADAIEKPVDPLRKLSDAFDEALGKQLDATEAALRYNQLFLDLKESVKENGTTLDEHTAKGIANRQMILSLIDAAEKNRVKTIEVTNDTNKANQVFRDQIAQIMAVAMALGFNKRQLDDVIKLLVELGKLPPIVKTIDLRLTGSSLAKAIASGRNPRNLGPAIPTFATGGMVGGPPGAPQLAVVHGGEFVVPRERVAAASGGSGGISVSFTGMGGGIDRMMASWFEEALRTGRIVIRSQFVQS